MMAYLLSPVRPIKARFHDRVSRRLDKLIEWVYLMTYQVELIEEISWCIFTEPLQCFHIHIKIWWSIDLHDWWNKSIWWLIEPAHRIKLVMHLHRTFSVFSHSYQSVVTDWTSERIPRWLYFPDILPIEFILTSLISSEILEVICGTKTQKVHHVTWSNKIIQRLRQLMDKEKSWLLIKKSSITHHAEGNSVASLTQMVVVKDKLNPLIAENLLKNLRDLIPSFSTKIPCQFPFME